MLISAKKNTPDKSIGDDPHYPPFADSLRRKIEEKGDERSRNLFNKLLKQLSKSPKGNKDDVLKQLEQLNQQFDRSSRQVSPSEHQYKITETTEPKVASIDDIKQNRKLIRRQFYVEEDGSQQPPVSQMRKEKPPSQYQKIIDENKKIQESNQDYDQRVLAAAKGFGLSEGGGNSIISTAYRGQKTVQSVYLNNMGQVVTSPQTGVMQTRQAVNPSNETTERRSSQVFTFPNVVEIQGKKAEKTIPLTMKNSAHRKSRGEFVVGQVTVSGQNPLKTIDPVRRSQIGSLPGLRTGPPGTAASQHRPPQILVANDNQTGVDITMSLANASSSDNPQIVKPPQGIPYNSTRPHHQKPGTSGGINPLLQSTERSNFEPLNF